MSEMTNWTWLRLRRGIAASTTCALLCGGCIFTTGNSGGDDDETAADDGDDDGSNAAVPPMSTEKRLEGCADGLSKEVVDDTLQITYDFNDSAHEMIVCGGLVFAIVGALIEGIVDLAQDPDRSTLPEQYMYDGEGTYSVMVDGFNDLDMDVRFYLTKDYAFGAAGDLVKENLFDMNNYLLNAKTTVETEVTTSGIILTITVEHDGPGPLVELLGMGENPPSPIQVSQSDLENAASELGQLEVEANIALTDHPSVASITYVTDSPRMLANSIFNGAPMQLDMIESSGVREDLHQTLTIDTWTVDYVDGAVGALDGEIAFRVQGDNFDFDASLVYPESNAPDITISCAE
jgi:hypothetical protein